VFVSVYILVEKKKATFAKKKKKVPTATKKKKYQTKWICLLII
jgi:hypothetical protein